LDARAPGIVDQDFEEPTPARTELARTKSARTKPARRVKVLSIQNSAAGNGGSENSQGANSEQALLSSHQQQLFCLMLSKR
jgi:hypothetical protein